MDKYKTRDEEDEQEDKPSPLTQDLKLAIIKDDPFIDGQK